MNGNVARMRNSKSFRGFAVAEARRPRARVTSLGVILLAVNGCSQTPRTERSTQPLHPSRSATLDNAISAPQAVPTPSIPRDTEPNVSGSISTSGAEFSLDGVNAVCLPDAKPGHIGHCVRLGDTWFRLWGAVKTGKMPKALVTDRQSKYLYSSNMGSAGEDGLSVYLTDPLRFERNVALRGNAVEMLLTDGGQALWVSDAQDWGKLKRYDTQTWRVEREIAVPGFPKWMAATRDGSQVFASLWNLDGVSRVEWPSGVVKTARTRRGNVSNDHSKNPRGMALSHDETELYVVNNHDHSLSVLDVASLAEKERRPIGFAPRHIVAGVSPQTFLVSLTGEDAAVEWDATARKTLRRFALGKRPKTIALSHDGKYLFSANFVGNSVSVVDVESGKSVELALNVHKPSGLAVRADDRFVYVSGFCSNDIWAIERFKDGETPYLALGSDRDHRPCLTCASTFAGCPFPPGHAPQGGTPSEVKSDAEWGWKSPNHRK